MAYDWTGARSRRTRRIKFALASLIVLAAVTAPVLAFSWPRWWRLEDLDGSLVRFGGRDRGATGAGL